MLQQRFVSFFTMIVFANSSWHWLTKTKPFDILPYVAIFTILVEYIAIKIINLINNSIRLLLIICLANLASFLLPYALIWTSSLAAVGYSFEMSVNHLPMYIVGLGYLFLTLIAEVPLVYISYKGIITEKRRLFISIIIVNVTTTMIIAIIERMVCRGSW